MVSSTSASTDPVDRAQPLAAALLILKELGLSGRYVWLTSKAIGDQDERLFYLRQAIGHLRQRGREGPGKYHELPVDPRTFVECPMLLAMHGEVYPKIMVEIEQMCSGRYVEAVLSGGIGTGKRLCVDTPIPTPRGFVAMGELQPGDQVYGADGEPCTVLLAHPIEVAPDSWEVVFSDGAVILADAEHNWFTQTFDERRNDARSGGHRGAVRTTRQIRETLMHRGQVNHAVPLCLPVRGKHTNRFGTDPYLLGVWLGDGAASAARVTIPDAEILAAFRARHVVRHIANYDYGISNGFLDVLDYWHLKGAKRIPKEWLQASVEQRLAIVQGFMDADGTVDRRTGSVSFLQKSRKVFDGIVGLLWSLGFKVSTTKVEKTFQGKTGTYWIATFVSRPAFPVFRLERKRRLLRAAGAQASRCRRRYIVAVNPIAPRPMRCITVDSPDHQFLCGREHIPTHNTTMALIATAYSLYELSCMRAPHKAFGLAQSSEIEFIFQSLKKELAKEVDYARFKAMLDNSPYFQEVFRYDRAIESQLKFPKRIGVKPLTGAATAAIGQNVFGGVIDEINFMAVVEQSKTSTADGGVYDQAKEVYNSIARRRQSRFMVQGRLPGMLCLVSSKQYPGEFTDRKMAQALTDPTIFVYDKRVWEVKPEGTFSGVWFPVFVGDETRKPRLLGPTEPVAETDRDLVVDVPEEYRAAFEEDLLAALRDIAGVSTQALYPFLPDSDAVNEAFGKVASVLSRPDCDFTAHRLQIYPKRITKPEEPRFVHIDLGLSADHCGVACGYIQQFRPIPRGDDSEVLPTIVLDFILDVIPPRGGEIEFENIRKLLYALRNNGLPIKWVTLDSFQSVDSRQILARQGFVTGQVSLDKDTNGYDIAKQAFYDRRVLAPEHTHAQQELVRLERDPKTRKVDHPTRGSKDCADAIAGVISGLTTRRELWLRHGIPLRNIPKSLVRAEPGPAAVSQHPRRHVSYA